MAVTPHADSRGSWYYIILYIDTDLMLPAAVQAGIVRQLHGYRGFHSGIVHQPYRLPLC